MKLWRQIVVAALLALTPVAAWAVDTATGVKPETTTLYRAAREQVDKLGTTVAAKYAPEVIEQAKASIAQAQKGLEAGNDTTTRMATERATLQTKLAQSVTEERIAAEKTEDVKKELTSLDQRLTKILTGKGEKP